MTHEEKKAKLAVLFDEIELIVNDGDPNGSQHARVMLFTCSDDYGGGIPGFELDPTLEQWPEDPKGERFALGTKSIMPMTRMIATVVGQHAQALWRQRTGQPRLSGLC